MTRQIERRFFSWVAAKFIYRLLSMRCGCLPFHGDGRKIANIDENPVFAQARQIELGRQFGLGL
jgi:hypothetical protein